MIQALDAVSNLVRFFSTHPMTHDSQLAAWARFVLWQIRSRVKREVIFEWIGGQRLIVRRGMTGATGNIYVGLHEFCDMMLLLHFLREGDLFVDIGANIGSYTILASGVRRATTLAFEPDPDTVAALRRNIEINDLGGRATVDECALGDRDGTVLFTQGLDTVNRVAVKGEPSARSVSVRRLDSVISAGHPTMIKMDVEGYEEAVVRGAQRLLADEGLKVIELETVTPEIASTFDRCGFVRGYYDPFGRSLTRVSNALPSSNTLFVRDWDFVTKRVLTASPVNILGKSI